jgi:hypothetical protein
MVFRPNALARSNLSFHSCHLWQNPTTKTTTTIYFILYLFFQCLTYQTSKSSTSQQGSVVCKLFRDLMGSFPQEKNNEILQLGGTLEP